MVWEYYYELKDGPVNFQLTGAVNQAIKVYTSGGADDRAALTLFARKQGDSYAQSTLADIGVTGNMSYQVYRFPLTTSSDLKIVRR